MLVYGFVMQVSMLRTFLYLQRAPAASSHSQQASWLLEHVSVEHGSVVDRGVGAGVGDAGRVGAGVGGSVGATVGSTGGGSGTLRVEGLRSNEQRGTGRGGCA